MFSKMGYTLNGKMR